MEPVEGEKAMKHGEELTRETIVRALAEALDSLDYVHAFYEGGAAASDTVDKWSDLDFYVVVGDDKVNDILAVIERALETLSPIQLKYEPSHLEWPGLYQAFYKLAKANRYLLIDLVVLKTGSAEKFLQPEIHGDVVFHINKSDAIKPPPLDRVAFVRKLQERVKKLRARCDMSNDFVQKEINRHNDLEAIDLYHNLTLAMLVEVLRIRHNPLHYDFGMHYVRYELPAEALRRLSHLYFVRDGADLQRKYDEATQWLRAEMSEIREDNVERLVESHLRS